MVVPTRESYFVYVDEAGDRGWRPTSSPAFVLAAVIVKQDEDRALRDALDKINIAMGRPSGAVLHWSENIRDHADRKFVARQLADLPATFVVTVLNKTSLAGRPTGLSDSVRQYNYLVRRLLERVSWYLSRHRGEATLFFGHVRRFKYDELHRYLDYLRVDPDCRINWETFARRYPTIEQPSSIRGLQVADSLAGCVYAALQPDRHDHVELSYLREVVPRLWTGPTSKLHTYGLHVVGAQDCHETYAWWPEIARLARS